MHLCFLDLIYQLFNLYRAHFSAITEYDIKAAMRNLGRPDQNVVSLFVREKGEVHPVWEIDFEPVESGQRSVVIFGG